MPNVLEMHPKLVPLGLVIQAQVQAPLPRDDLHAHAVPGIGLLEFALGDAVSDEEARACHAERKFGRPGEEVGGGRGDGEAGAEEVG